MDYLFSLKDNLRNRKGRPFLSVLWFVRSAFIMLSKPSVHQNEKPVKNVLFDIPTPTHKNIELLFLESSKFLFKSRKTSFELFLLFFQICFLGENTKILDSGKEQGNPWDEKGICETSIFQTAKRKKGKAINEFLRFSVKICPWASLLALQRV